MNQLYAMLETDQVHELYELEVRLQENAENQGQDESVKFPTEISEKCQEILRAYEDVFRTPSELPPRRIFDHHIYLQPGSRPVNVRPYRYPHFQKNEIEKIQSSHSPFSSPVLLVKKKDGTFRFCVDYRALNNITVKDKFPIPTADVLFDELGKARYFTKLDLRAGYHQIRVHERDLYKTAFRMHEGHYEFIVMPFGLTNAPSTFQTIMNSTLAEYLRRFVVVFFDDILIYSNTDEDHMVHLAAVLQRLRTSQFVVKLTKCQFYRSSIEYLGHFVSEGGLQPDPAKIEAMTHWPLPKNIKQLRGFLGLTGYYRRFIQKYTEIAAPLTDLLKRDSFQWTGEATGAFEALKLAMTRTPVLRLPDFDITFVIESAQSLCKKGTPLLTSARN